VRKKVNLNIPETSFAMHPNRHALRNHIRKHKRYKQA
jgi:hypothetical protein